MVDTASYPAGRTGQPWYSDWFKDLCVVAARGERIGLRMPPHADQEARRARREDLRTMVLAVLEHLGLCDICGQPVCTECKVCSPCGGDGHDEGCSKGFEHTHPCMYVCCSGHPCTDPTCEVDR